MTDEDFDELLELCKDFSSKHMQARAAAALEATEFLKEFGYSWTTFLGKNAQKIGPSDPTHKTHKYNGFIPFADSLESTYDEARGYSVLLATTEEKIILRKIMTQDVPLNKLAEEEYQLIQKLRDVAREVRDMFVGEVFKTKSGREFRIVSSQP